MDEVKPVERPERRLRLAPPEQGCSSPSVVFIGFSAKVTTPSVSVLVLQSIWPLCSSIWRLKFWSWLETPLGTTRRPYHPPSPAAGGAQRRGAEQTHGPSDHRPGRRTAQHPGRAAAQEDRETRQSQVNRFKSVSDTQRLFKSRPSYLLDWALSVSCYISSD